MRTVSIEPEMTMVGVTDARTGILAFTLSVAPIQAQKSMDLKTMRSNFATNFKQRLGLKQNVVLQDVQGELAPTLSNFFLLPKEMKDSDYRAQGAYGLVKMPNNHWAVLSFTITGQEPKARALYVATGQKMFTSVMLGTAKRGKHNTVF